MGVNVRVVGQKFYAKLNNGNDYTENLTDFSQHLKGGVLEEIKAVFNVQIEWGITIGSQESVLFSDTTSNTLRISITGMDFGVGGFSIGDTVKLSDIAFGYRGVITSLQVGEILIDVTERTGGAIGFNGFLSPDEITYLTGTTHKTALKYDFGFIENNEPINFLSKLTNETQTYLFEGINHGTPNVFVDGKSFGNNKASYSGSSSVAFVQYVADRDQIRNEDTTQEFQIEHTFKINPFFRDSELDSLKGTDKPPLDIFNGDASLKYVFQTEFRTVLSNPNTSMVSSYDTQLGSVGYFDESYNGYENNYTVSDLTYTVGTKVVDRLDVGSVTNVSFTLSNDNSIFTASNPLIIGHSAVVNSLDYSFNPKYYDDVWTNETLRTSAVASPSPVSGTAIKNYTATRVDSSNITVSFDVEFTADQIALLSENQDYALYYTFQNPALDVDNGDKVTGRIDVNYYSKNNDVSGLFDFDIFTQYPHPLDINEVGFTSAKTFNESGMMAKGRFWILNGAILNDLKFDITIYKTDDTWDSLRSLVIDLSEQTTVNGIQQIELDSTRGYILTDSDIFNFLKVTTDTNDGTKQYYDIEVGYRIPWQSWLKFDNAPVAFYDKTKSNNGLNQKASNYSKVLTSFLSNIFTDGDNGTFENQTTTGLTSLIYSAGTPNQIGNGLGINAFGYNSSYSGLISVSAPSMTETNKNYKIFTSDTPFSVTQGKPYVIESYVSMVDSFFDPRHIDNGSYYWLPDGYDFSECTVTPFEIITANLYDGNPVNRVWVKTSTTFVAKNTETLLVVLYETIKTDIPTNTGGQFDTDTITFREGVYDYSIKMLFDSIVNETRYVTTSEEIEVYDYDESVDFTCETKTYKKDDSGDIVPIANNIIQDGYTQLQAIFTPLIPPTFTESVDFTEVATVYDPLTGYGWKRFAHGNKFTNASFPRLVNWINEQADADDYFSDGTSNFIKTNPSLYSTGVDGKTILAQKNMGAVYGCYSVEKYEYYSISGTMFSTSIDDDAIKYDIAFNVDENGVEHTLSLCATSGGLLFPLNVGQGVLDEYDPNDLSTQVFTFPDDNDILKPQGFCRASLVYNYGKASVEVLDDFSTGVSRRSWATAGDLNFTVKRSSDNIEVSIDWTIDTIPYTHTFNYNLNGDILTEKFKGFSEIGFSFMSQDQGGFKNVNLTAPQNEFYSEMRIDPKESQGDFTDSRISSHISAPANGILQQITANENKATLSWDGTSFIAQCLIDTTQVIKGGEYDFSAELRPLNLEV